MFLFFDVGQFRKQLDYNQTLTCHSCGHFGRYEVYLMGNRFRLFFIPIFTFGKKYMVKSSCCESWYVLDSQKGKAIERHETVSIELADLDLYQEGRQATGRCDHCQHAYPTGSRFCPHCGNPLQD